jgi:hypothetical protein
MTGTIEARMLQMAYRAAVNQSSDSSPPPLEGLQAKVEERFETFREGAMSVSSILANNQTAAAIVAGGVVLGLAGAVTVVSKNWKTVGEKHAKLEEEILEQVSMFGVRETGVTPKPTFEQKLIRAYYIELEKELWLMRYSGIRRIEAPEPGAKTMYFVLPFYTMDTKVLKPLASMNAVDKVRTLIDTFLRVQLPEALAGIERAFESYKKYTLLSAGKYVAEKGNFLNNWRSARFMMITLGNLLWNLQHPGDLKTGHHVSTEQCVKYCHRMLMLLNSLLNPQEAPFLVHTSMFGHVHEESQQLHKFITSVQLLVRNLHQAYRYDQMNTINLADLTNTSHRVLGTLNTVLFKLLYQRKSKEANMLVPDEYAADSLSACFNELTLVLQGKNAIVDVFQPYRRKFKDIPYMNDKVTTLIDILIVFTHLPYGDRTALVTALREKTQEYTEPSWAKFAEGLDVLEQRFIQPIAMQDQSYRFYQSAQAARITGRRLLPFFTLLMAALRTDVDTGNSYQLAQNEQNILMEANPELKFDVPLSDTSYEYEDGMSNGSQVTSRSTLNMGANLDENLKIQRTGRQQIEAINFQARQAEGESGYYFSWRVELFTQHMPASAKTFMAQIHRLPLEADQLIELVKILDAIAAVRDLDPVFLQEEEFKRFFLRYLNKIKDEFRTFNQKLERAGETISSNEGVSPQMQSIFSNMMEEMEGSLKAVDTAANTLASIVDNPNFMSEEKKSLATLVRFIERGFTALYPQDEKPGVAILLSVNDEGIGAHQRHYETRETRFTGEPAKKSTTRRMMSALMHIRNKKQESATQTEGLVSHALNSSTSRYHDALGASASRLGKRRSYTSLHAASFQSEVRDDKSDFGDHKREDNASEDRHDDPHGEIGVAVNMERADSKEVHPRLQRKFSSGSIASEQNEDLRANTGSSSQRKLQKQASLRCINGDTGDLGDSRNTGALVQFTSPRRRGYNRYATFHEEDRKNEAQTVALQLWMDECLKHMSSLSRYEYKSSCMPSLSFGGHKGQLLNKLIDEVSTKSELSDEELAFYFLNLVRLIGSVRETPFGLFQAEWGRTRAMEPILKAIRNPTYNRMFPFEKILFGGKNLDLDCLTDDALIQELMEVCRSQRWELAVDKIKASSLDYDSYESAFI